VLFSAKHKLRGVDGVAGKKGYRARKQASIQLVEAWLAEHPQPPHCTALFREAKKRDDLADALAMAIAYSRLPPARPVEVHAREPSAYQRAKGKYTKANIKHILCVEWRHTVDPTLRTPSCATPSTSTTSTWTIACGRCGPMLASWRW
jgi:hypothetical protein